MCECVCEREYVCVRERLSVCVSMCVRDCVRVCEHVCERETL